MVVLFLALSAHAATVEALVEVRADGPHLIDAVLHGGEMARGADGTVEVRDVAGNVLTRGVLTDPRLRSVLEPEGGRATQLPTGVARVRMSWPENAAVVALGGELRQPRPALPPPISAYAVRDSGPSDERLDLVFLGDGYTAGELDEFADDVDRMVAYLDSIEPYSSYRGLFNIWRVDYASDESGVSHYDQGQSIDKYTAYGCYYGCGGIDRLICCDDGVVLSVVNEQVPAADGVLVLINDATYGGSGGFNYATSYVGEEGERVSAHELGHSLVGLWDEYDYGSTGSASGAPNCSDDGSGDQWSQWVGESGVDAYSVCSYTNLYRPTDDGCMMRTLSDGYCPVCREQVVLALYGQLPSLVTSATPASGTPIEVHLEDEPVDLLVEAVGPDAGLTWEWSVGGEVVETGDGALTVHGCEGWNGELQLRVYDDTSWVREDPNSRLAATLTWPIVTDLGEDCDFHDGGELIPWACDCQHGSASGLPFAGIAALAAGLARMRRPRRALGSDAR